MPKPLSPAMPFREVDQVLGVQHAAVETRGSAELDVLSRVSDPAMLREIIGLFLEDCPRQLDAVRAGLAAGDCQAVYRAAHTLKGSIGNFQSQEIVAHLQRLEARAREGNIAICVTIVEQIEREVGQLVGVLATTGDRLKCVS